MFVKMGRVIHISSVKQVSCTEEHSSTELCLRNVIKGHRFLSGEACTLYLILAVVVMLDKYKTLQLST